MTNSKSSRLRGTNGAMKSMAVNMVPGQPGKCEAQNGFMGTDDAGIDEWSSNSMPEDHAHDQPPVLPVEDQPMESGPSSHSPSVHWGGAVENQCS